MAFDVVVCIFIREREIPLELADFNGGPAGATFEHAVGTAAAATSFKVVHGDVLAGGPGCVLDHVHSQEEVQNTGRAHHHDAEVDTSVLAGKQDGEAHDPPAEEDGHEGNGAEQNEPKHTAASGKLLAFLGSLTVEVVEIIVEGVQDLEDNHVRRICFTLLETIYSKAKQASCQGRQFVQDIWVPPPINPSWDFSVIIIEEILQEGMKQELLSIWLMLFTNPSIAIFVKYVICRMPCLLPGFESGSGLNS